MKKTRENIPWAEKADMRWWSPTEGPSRYGGIVSGNVLHGPPVRLSRSIGEMLGGRVGVSADRLYGFERFNLQNNSRRGGTRHHGSADDLVGLKEERGGNCEAQGLSRLEVDDQLERGGLLHGKISRLGALQGVCSEYV